MAEIGIPYQLTGPDGSRAVFNDPTDPDFVGYLDQENGITGLLDTADVKEDIGTKVEGDGGIQGNNFLGRRAGTIQGSLWPNPDIITVELRRSKLNRASRGLKATLPSVLTWTPTGGVQRWLQVWRQGNVRYTGRRPKVFVVPLATRDPYNYSATLQQQVVVPVGGGSGDQGFTNPMTNPIATAYAVTASALITNSGDAETWPLLVIQGPITNPTLRNNTTGLQFTLTCTLASTDSLYVDTQLRTVMLNNTTNRYSYYAANATTNSWWSLSAGGNDVRMLSSIFASPAQLTVYWRHAWE